MLMLSRVVLIAIMVAAALAIAAGLLMIFLSSGEGRYATTASTLTTSGNESRIITILSSLTGAEESLRTRAGEVIIEGDIVVEADEFAPFSPRTTVHYKTYTVEKYVLRFRPGIVGEADGLVQFRGDGKLELMEYSVKAENIFEFEVECCEPCYASFSHEGSMSRKISDVIVFGNMTRSGELVSIKIQLAECPDCLICEHDAGTRSFKAAVYVPCTGTNVTQAKSEPLDLWMNPRDIEVVLISADPPFSFNKGLQKRSVNVKVNTNDMMMLTSKGLIAGSEVRLPSFEIPIPTPSEAPKGGLNLIYSGEITFHAQIPGK